MQNAKKSTAILPPEDDEGVALHLVEDVHQVDLLVLVRDEEVILVQLVHRLVLGRHLNPHRVPQRRPLCGKLIGIFWQEFLLDP